MRCFAPSVLKRRGLSSPSPLCYVYTRLFPFHIERSLHSREMYDPRSVHEYFHLSLEVASVDRKTPCTKRLSVVMPDLSRGKLSRPTSCHTLFIKYTLRPRCNEASPFLAGENSPNNDWGQHKHGYKRHRGIYSDQCGGQNRKLEIA